MSRDRPQFTPSSAIVQASARRIVIEHGMRANAFAAERLAAAREQSEVEMWRAITVALRAIYAAERVSSRGRR